MAIFAVFLYAVVLTIAVASWVSMGASLAALSVVMVVGAVIVSAMLSAAAVVCSLAYGLRWAARRI